MIDLSQVSSKERAFDLLDTYAVEQRQALKKNDLSKGTGIIKSYMIEREQGEPVQNLFGNGVMRLRQIEENFFNIFVAGEHYGFLEVLEARYLMIHCIKIAEKADRPVQRTVAQEAGLDLVWLSGYFLNRIWDVVIKPQYSHRFVKMHFEYNDVFRRGIERNGEKEDTALHQYRNEEDEADNEYDADFQRQSRLSIGMTASKIAEVLVPLQATLEDFKVMTRLRMPSAQVGVGGYDFWDWGKVSYRSPSFRDGRTQAQGLLETYKRTTELIEKIAWFQAERTRLNGLTDSFTVTGAPVTFCYPTSVSCPQTEKRPRLQYRPQSERRPFAHRRKPGTFRCLTA